ncbi:MULTISPECIES: thioredoxin [unclassified Crossiella]|uniref:thioredoxin n=1 Tax=unclassified Crossiella TaxID=2620835 RepID=UPI001FFE4123|nr:MULTISPECIES: thioredoxin [unclassified Crossiella]MCK2243830.1 thioredoxin [Crossiella sp. S99.2]MCK2257689.1 thioredoxin [Crossiella sp. S99.1]
MIDITEAEFPERVLNAEHTVLVEFWAPWCGPCRMVAPVLAEIEAERPELTVVKVNTDENPGLTRDLGVMAAPTLQVYRGGRLVRSAVGAKPKAQLLALLAE